MRLCTLHNYYAPVWLPETDEIMHPAQLLCTRMATGTCIISSAPYGCIIIMHPYGYKTDEIMHPAQLLCTRMATGN